jgi:hypothetical protein
MGEPAGWRQLIPLFIAAAWCHGPAAPFLPATFEPVVMVYGQSHAPALVALSASVISVVMEGLNYLGYGYVLRSDRLRRIRTSSARLTSCFQRWPFSPVLPSPRHRCRTGVPGSWERWLTIPLAGISPPSYSEG